MILGIHHVAISTGNLGRLVHFYTDVLGFEIVTEIGWKDNPQIDRIVGLQGSEADSVMLRTGNIYIELFQYHKPEGKQSDPQRPVSDHGYTHFCIAVEDIDAEYERLLAAGMTFHCPPPGGNDSKEAPVRATYGRDPDGNVIEIQEVRDPNIRFALHRAQFSKEVSEENP